MIRITGGIFKGRNLKVVPDPRTRYTSSMVRQAIFNMVDVKGKGFLELFCGSCIVTAEALSRGAESASVVDISRKAISVCRENLESLGVLEKVTIYKSDAVRFVKSRGKAFDIIFMDPPYGLGLVEEVLKAMRPDILKKGGIVIVEKFKKEGIFVPEFLEVLEERNYGDSGVVILRKV